MHANEELIHRFYKAFQAQDAETMASCYHPDVRFDDPVFQDLRGDRAGNMWRMLCGRAKDLRIEYRDVSADDSQGRAHWEAWYTFGATGNLVHNIIDAEFSFEDGQIVRHKDSFALWRWSRMALGARGIFLGWLPPVQGAIRKQAVGSLVAWEKKHGEAASPADA